MQGAFFLGAQISFSPSWGEVAAKHLTGRRKHHVHNLPGTKKKNYTVMSNTHLRDKRLSLKAIGLLSLILSLPEKDWQFSIRGLACICKDGVDAVREGIKELEKNGYIVCSRARKGNGQLGESVYLIYEAPLSGTGSNELGSTDIPETDDPEAVSSRLENPMPENPTQGSPGAENPTQINTDILNTEKENRYEPITDPSYPYSSFLSYPILHLQDGESIDQSSAVSSLIRKVRDQIGYDILIHRFAKDEVDNIVSLMEEGLSADS